MQRYQLINNQATATITYTGTDFITNTNTCKKMFQHKLLGCHCKATLKKIYIESFACVQRTVVFFVSLLVFFKIASCMFYPNTNNNTNTNTNTADKTYFNSYE